MKEKINQFNEEIRQLDMDLEEHQGSISDIFIMYINSYIAVLVQYLIWALGTIYLGFTV